MTALAWPAVLKSRSHRLRPRLCCHQKSCWFFLFAIIYHQTLLIICMDTPAVVLCHRSCGSCHFHPCRHCLSNSYGSSLSTFFFAQVHVQFNLMSFKYLEWQFKFTLAHHFCLNSHHTHPLVCAKMSTPETIKQLVKEISTLSSSLSDAVPKGSKDNKIYSVMNTNEGNNPHEAFNRWFNALFGEDCHDSSGCLRHLRQGKLRMGLIISYLSKIDWTKDFPLDLVEIKLQPVVDELKHLQ